jgi:hypothetical protein
VKPGLVEIVSPEGPEPARLGSTESAAIPVERPEPAGPSPQGPREVRVTMTLEELMSSRLFDAIVNVPWNASKASVVLASIGYPLAGRPRYPNRDDWQPFWMEICEAIKGGVLYSGRDLLPLVQAVARIYPKHPLLEHYAP